MNQAMSGSLAKKQQGFALSPRENVIMSASKCVWLCGVWRAKKLVLWRRMVRVWAGTGSLAHNPCRVTYPPFGRACPPRGSIPRASTLAMCQHGILLPYTTDDCRNHGAHTREMTWWTFELTTAGIATATTCSRASCQAC
jgi:hypothetical protein